MIFFDVFVDRVLIGVVNGDIIVNGFFWFDDF